MRGCAHYIAGSPSHALAIKGKGALAIKGKSKGKDEGGEGRVPKGQGKGVDRRLKVLKAGLKAIVEHHPAKGCELALTLLCTIKTCRT